MKRNITKDLTFFYTTLIVVMPILNIYRSSLYYICIGELLAVFLMFFLTIYKLPATIKIRNISYWIFIIYMIMTSLILVVFIKSYSYEKTFYLIFKLLLYTILFIVLSEDFFDLKIGIKLYIAVAFLSSIYLIMQFVFKMTTGIILPTVIPAMDLYYNLATSEIYTRSLQLLYSFNYRPSGFFLEPAHFCQYTIYSVILILAKDNKKQRDYFILGIISIAILLSYSAIGYLSLLLSFIIWFWSTRKKRKSITNIIVIFIMSVILIFISIRFGFWESSINRILTVKSNHSTTGTLRILRGWVVYLKMPIIFKVFGMGVGNYGSFIDQFNITTMFDNTLERTNEYMNTLSMILVNTGIVGMALYIISMLKIYLSGEKWQKDMMLIFILVLSVSSIFFSASYMLPMIFICWRKRKNSI